MFRPQHWAAPVLVTAQLPPSPDAMPVTTVAAAAGGGVESDSAPTQSANAARQAVRDPPIAFAAPLTAG